MKFYFSVELSCFFLKERELGAVPRGDKLISFFQFFCSHVQGNGKKIKEKISRKKKGFICMKEGQGLNEAFSSAKAAILFCDISTLPRLSHCDTSFIVKLETF